MLGSIISRFLIPVLAVCRATYRLTIRFYGAVQAKFHARTRKAVHLGNYVVWTYISTCELLAACLSCPTAGCDCTFVALTHMRVAWLLPQIC